LSYRFCPRCGHELTLRSQPHGTSPQLVCPACGFVFYRNSKPCAGALVVRDSRVLLARRALPPARGAWDIPGGFLELGEDPQHGVLRELREETGLEIRILDLLGIYIDRYGEDDWTLNIYYLADAPNGTPRPADDVADLAWFSPDEIPDQMAFAHERQVLDDWRRRFAA
jgi:ADP-ribose pyrophosphatase YjhB (NUDIX family)